MNLTTITKCLIGIIICAISLFPASALAVTIPAKDGYIQDTAQILSPLEYEEIQEAIDEATFSLYLLTLDSVDGSSISTVGSSTFSQWALGNEDVLLVIAMAEQEVNVSIGSTLDKSISQAADYMALIIKSHSLLMITLSRMQQMVTLHRESYLLLNSWMCGRNSWVQIQLTTRAHL